VQDQSGDTLLVVGAGAVLLASAPNATVRAIHSATWGAGSIAAFTPSGRIGLCSTNWGLYAELDAASLVILTRTQVACGYFLLFNRGYVYTMATQYTDSTYLYVSYYVTRLQAKESGVGTGMDVAGIVIFDQLPVDYTMGMSAYISDEHQIAVVSAYMFGWFGFDLLAGTQLWETTQNVPTATGYVELFANQQPQQLPALNQVFASVGSTSFQSYTGVCAFSIFDGSATWRMPGVTWLSAGQPMAFLSADASRYEMVLALADIPSQSQTVARYSDSGLRPVTPPPGFRNASGLPNFPGVGPNTIPPFPSWMPPVTLPPFPDMSPPSPSSDTSTTTWACVGAGAACFFGGIARCLLCRRRRRQAAASANGDYTPIIGTVVPRSADAEQVTYEGVQTVQL
jgi:hypothetical protein